MNLPGKLPVLLLAAAMAVASVPASASETVAKRAEIATLKARAQEAGRTRVIVELKLGPKASRRVIRGLQRSVVSTALGAAAWHQRDTGRDVHGVSLMTVSPMFAANVTAAEIDRLAGHSKVRRIVADGLSAPNAAKPDKPM